MDDTGIVLSDNSPCPVCEGAVEPGMASIFGLQRIWPAGDAPQPSTGSQNGRCTVCDAHLTRPLRSHPDRAPVEVAGPWTVYEEDDPDER
jgi:hypothetical protein